MLHIHPQPSDRFVVEVTGALDASEVGRAGRQLDGISQQNPQGVVFDLGGAFFLDSTGLTLLVKFHKQAIQQGCQVVFCAVPERIMELLRITRLHQIFTFAPDQDQALAMVGA